MTADAKARDLGYAWRLLGVLMLAALMSYLDRQVIAIMAEHLRHDFTMTDTQIGLLQGLPFAVFFALAAMPIGWLCDRTNRIVILSVAIGLWSLCTALGAFAHSYGELLVLRMGVAIGEAAVTPVVYPLIAETFPRGKAGRATSFLQSCNYLGSGLAYAVGGPTLDALGRLGKVSMPFAGEIFGWQLTFLLVAVPGLVLAPLILLFKDPRPRIVRSLASDRAARSSDTAGWRHLRRHWRAFATVYLIASLAAAVVWGTSAWVPAFFQRTYHWTATQIGPPFGLIYSLGPMLGVLVVGWLSDGYDRRGIVSGKIMLSAIGAAALVLVAAFPLMPTPQLALALLAPFYFLLGATVGLAPLAVQEITPAGFRGQATSLYILTVNLIGAGVGPMVPGLITDRVLQNPDKLRYGLLCLSLSMLPILAVIAWLGRRPYTLAAEAAARVDVAGAPAS